MCYLCNKDMRLESCVRRDDKMEFRGTSCMLYIHKHRDTSPETWVRRTLYDDEGVHGEHDTKGFR